MELQNKFHEILKILIKKHDITQAELGKQLGVRPNTISTYCTGTAKPDLDSLLQIASYFGVSTDYLLTGERIENKITREELGLSEQALENLAKKAKTEREGSMNNISFYVDMLLSDAEFYAFLEDNDRGIKEAINDSELMRKFIKLTQNNKFERITETLKKDAIKTGAQHMWNYFRIFYSELLEIKP